VRLTHRDHERSERLADQKGWSGLELRFAWACSTRCQKQPQRDHDSEQRRDQQERLQPKEGSGQSKQSDRQTINVA
jgi:hypothetical protein